MLFEKKCSTQIVTITILGSSISYEKVFLTGGNTGLIFLFEWERGWS